MNIYIAGSGKLASTILSELEFEGHQITNWVDDDTLSEKEQSIIIHAGSGRQLNDIIRYCNKTKSILIELSTGLITESLKSQFTLVVCPNISILLLKTMYMIQKFGHHFDKNSIDLIESHQSSKKSVPGTAFNFADSLRLKKEEITSVRNIKEQKEQYHIPEEYLKRHAFHQISIKDGADEVRIETKVLGHNSYVRGVKKLLEVLTKRKFELRSYSILEMIDKNWI